MTALLPYDAKVEARKAKERQRFPIHPLERLKPCTKDDCDGDPGAGARAERIAEVTAYWQRVGAE